MARLKQIVEILYKREKIQVRELAQLLDVSEMTIRRDLGALSESGIALNVRGLAMLNARLDMKAENGRYSLQLAAHSHLKEKDRIGARAAALIDDEDCIIIDNGTTTERLARSIAPDLKITVLTPSLNIIGCLCNNPNISLICGGGYFHRDTSLFESLEGILLIDRIRANKVFVSTSGVHRILGVTCTNCYELTTKQAILRSGAEKILLTDSSKFGVIKTTFFAALDDFDRIVTDRNLSPEWADCIRERGIELTIA
jgi:DeoR family deoxyribose operon repressor